MSDFRLKVFYSVAKNLSFTKASQELFVSQPAVTKHVHELESMYHVRLFDRMNNKITLSLRSIARWNTTCICLITNMRENYVLEQVQQ